MNIVDHGTYVSIYADTNKFIRRIGTTDTMKSINVPKGEEANFEDCEEEMKYSVRSIIRELKALGKFAAVRSMLEAANYDWDFIGSNYLSSEDEDFKTMMAAIVSQGIMTQAELDELLPKCIWEQTPMA